MLFYPKGERELDDELVNKTLSFLDEESNKHFENALRFYNNKEPIQSAESLRRSIEEFLRTQLKNDKGLKENISLLGKELKKEGSQSELRGIIHQIFHKMDAFFNEHSKHGDGKIDEVCNEVLIYQSGLLMRYIYKIFRTE